MKDFNHLHVLTLIGISMDKHDHPLVVLPFMKHGDLLSYIRGEANVSVSPFSHIYSLDCFFHYTKFCNVRFE